MREEIISKVIAEIRRSGDILRPSELAVTVEAIMRQEIGGTPPPQTHLVGKPTAYLVRRFSNDGVLLDTELSFTKPVIRSTSKTEFVPLFAATEDQP